jgi:hypothetical protein
MLNDPLVLALAGHWAERICSEESAAIDERIERMIRTAYGRPAGDEEKLRFTAMLDELARLHGVEQKNLATSRTVWRDAAHALFLTEEFVFIP